MPFPRSLRALLCAALLLSGSCDSPTGPRETPWNELPTVSLAVPVTGTVQPGESVDYAVVHPADSFRLVFQARSGSAADSLVAEVLDAEGEPLARVTSRGDDASARPRTSVWVGDWGSELRVRVSGQGADDGGAFMLGVGIMNERPEWVADRIQTGQVVEGEQIEGDADVDVFRISGEAGDEWIVFAQATPGWSHVQVELVDSATSQRVAQFDTYVTTDALEELSSGRVVLPSTGTYLVRVAPTLPWRAHWTGEYRLKVYEVDRAPENGPAALQLGDVVSETIPEVGDADEFTFTAAAGQEMNLLLQLTLGMSSRLDLALTHQGQVLATLDAQGIHGSLDDHGTGRITLPADGEYRVRVHGPAQGVPATATGSYRFELYPVDRAPENGAQLGLDTPPASGAIDRPGDVDEFLFPGTAGQHVVIHITSPAPSTAGILLAELVSPSGATLSDAVNTFETPPYSERYSWRVLLGTTGTYRLRVGGHAPWSFARGAYTVQAYTIDPAPEHVPAVVQIGQTVTGERIDRPGDLDLFTFQGTLGTQATVSLGSSEAQGLAANVRSDLQPFSLVHAFAHGPALDSVSTGRISLSTRTYHVAVNPVLLGSSYMRALTGAYSFRVFPIDRAPEGRPAAYAPGDTVKAELLYPSGDVDVYSFTLASAARLRVYWGTPAATGPDDAVRGWLVSAQEEVLWNSESGGPPAFVDLPAGTYRFEVKNANYEAPLTGQIAVHHAHLPYAFALIP